MAPSVLLFFQPISVNVMYDLRLEVFTVMEIQVAACWVVTCVVMQLDTTVLEDHATSG
jgi:hypothetical protein